MTRPEGTRRAPVSSPLLLFFLFSFGLLLFLYCIFSAFVKGKGYFCRLRWALQQCPGPLKRWTKLERSTARPSGAGHLREAELGHRKSPGEMLPRGCSFVSFVPACSAKRATAPILVISSLHKDNESFDKV